MTLAEREREEANEVLPYMDEVQQSRPWPDVMKTLKRQPRLEPVVDEEIRAKRKAFSSKEARTVQKLMQTYLRMQDVGRILRVGMQDAPGDGRGWAAVALVQLQRYKEAARLAAGPDGQSPCGFLTLRYVAHALAKAGALEAALHLSALQTKCDRSRHITQGSRMMQSTIEVASLYLQATTQNMPRLLAAHGQQIAQEVEKLVARKDDILALTPNRRFLMLTQAFNQLIRWYGHARLVPQALRACEIMNEFGIPRDDMTIHFLSKGAAQQYVLLKRAKRYTQAPPDWPGFRPEVIFIGRTNSGKSAIINALFSCLTKVAPSSKTKAWTRFLDWYEVNRQMAGLPHFALVDTPGLGHAGVPASVTRDWPDLLYEYFSKRESLTHVFHLCDARNKRLLPADKTLIHLLASAQRPRVRYTIVITKIDACSRKVANSTANSIREEMAPYCDVDIMFTSARTLRGIDHLWAKIWQSVTETPRGQRHKNLGMQELQRLYKSSGLPKEGDLAEMFGLPRTAPPVPKPEDFDSESWAEDRDFDPVKPNGGGRKGYFNDRWGQELEEEDDAKSMPGEENDDPEGSPGWDGEAEWDNESDVEEDDTLGLLGSEEELEKRWEETLGRDTDGFNDSSTSSRMSEPGGKTSTRTSAV